MAKSKKPPARSEGTTPAPAQPPEVPAPGSPSVLELFKRAQAGDESSMGVFKGLLDHPERGPKVVEFFGNLAARAEDFAVELVAGSNLAVKAATPRKLAKLRAELEGPDPGPIERLLAERAAYCWLILWEYESALVLRKGEMSFKQFEFHQRRIDAAHRRFLSSLRTLATVQKLGVPNIQVNVGGHQVNVAGQ